MPRTAWRRTAAVLALAVVPLLSACSIGVNASTSVQGPSGNGASATVGTIQLRGITIVTGAAPSTSATIIGTIVNTGTEDDVLTGITILAPTGATAVITGPSVTGGQIPLPAARPTSAVSLGFNSDYNVDISGLTIDPTAYAQVQFTFQNAGTVVVPTMAVPPSGIYTGLGPSAS